MNRVVFLFCALLTACFLWPSEGAINGDGLHLVIGSLGLASFAAFKSAKAVGTSVHQRAILRVASVLPFVILGCGFWLSTWHVFEVHGDRRAALNLAFEWTGILTSCWLIYRIIRTLKDYQTITILIVTLGVGMSVMGIAQHHVTYNRQADWYLQQRSRLVEARESGQLEASVLENQMQEMGVPLDGPGLELFENRLLSSSEPFATFALANTLGGLLAPVIVLLCAAVLEMFRQRAYEGGFRWVVFGLLVAVVGYCLLLTKSRTAWVGCVVGIGTLFFQHYRRGSTAWFRRVLWVVAGFIVVGTFGMYSGAIDKEVILEAPKSLQYRMFYWIGASGVIAESPVWGAGPGNFRQSYVGHKVAESSEEILDPHNIFLDAWGAAGIVGFVAICWIALRLMQRTFAAGDTSTEDSTVATGLSLKNLLGAIGFGTLLHLGWRWCSGGAFVDFGASDFFLSQDLLLLVPTFGCLAVVLLQGRMNIPVYAFRSAAICLLVHLMGAGGLQISIVGLLLCLFFAISEIEWQPVASGGEVGPGSVGRGTSRLALSVIPVVGAAIVFWWGLVPVLRSQANIAVAEFRSHNGETNAAVVAYDLAIQVDPLSVQSRQQKLEVLTYELMRSADRYAQNSNPDISLENRVKSEFEQVSQASAELIDADRRSLAGYLFRSRAALQAYRVIGDPAILRSSVDDMQYVVNGYPTNAAYVAELAVLHQVADNSEEAGKAAETALRLESINRVWGHSDRYLDESTIAKLKLLVESE
ncbi:MAG: O-antigen ligase family protein [Fuerstiella sp.]